MRKILALAAVAAFLLLVPWAGMLDFESDRVQVDGIATSAVIVMALAVSFSMVSWSILSWASKSIKPVGILLSIITGAALVIPFIQVLGPTAGVLVGAVAGFSAFMLQKKTTNPTNNRPAVITYAALAAAYVGLTMLVLAAQSVHDGIGAWSGTAEGIEESGFENIFNNGIGFAYFLAIVPSLVATGVIIRGRKLGPGTRS